MSISNEALQKLFSEIEQKAVFAQQQISIVKSQMAAKGRESRMLQLTSGEIDSLPQDANVYEGVGKMTTEDVLADVEVGARFVASPIPETKKRLAKESEDIKGEVTNLQKKLDYLETTFKNSNQHLEQILKNGGR
ncbi:hypothetical protein H2203_004162 [Taxawa tesnikishii (nom. ined.)]|nr:hypothetical protein H2203_004162 [Dothideales sp. JES 119]